MASRAVRLKVCYNFLNLVMVAECKQKMAAGLVTFVRNLTLTCYGYFM